MADDTTVVTENDGKFVPEPVPDTIADTEINGLEPTPTDEAAEVEKVNDDTNDDQPDEAKAEEVEEPEDTPEEADKPLEDAPVEQPDAKELARTKFEERQVAKAERDYVKEQRQQIREYEQQSDTSDVEERMKILEAKQYVDTVERNRQAVAGDVSRAQTDIPFFKADTEQSRLLFQQSLENFANAYGVTDPETGQWLAAQDRNGNEVQLLPYLQQQAATYEQALADSQRAVQKTEAKMRAKAVNPSNTGKVTSTGNELDDLLDKIGDVQLV